MSKSINLLCLILPLPLAVTVFLPASNSKPIISNQSSSESDQYFPETEIKGMGKLLTGFLKSEGEPSLLAIAQADHRAECYRLDWVGSTSLRLLAIRLSLSADGTGQITTVQGKLGATEFHKTERQIPDADANRFLQRLAKADFWSMPSLESDDTDPNSPRSYKMDGEIWLFEGVHAGTYHVIYRHSPDPGPFTQMVHYLAADLARLDESWTPKPSPPPVRSSQH